MATVVALPAEAPSRLPRRVTLGLGATLGAVACAATTWVVASSTVLVQPLGAGILRGLYVGTAVAVGVYTWWRRPQSQLGPLVAGIGFLYALTSLNAAEENALFTLGMS